MYHGRMSAPLTPRRRILRYCGWALGSLVVLAVVGLSGIVYAWASFAHSLPDLHGWHVDSPDSEFRARDAKAAYTFDDYLSQEDRVFGELDALMRGKWAQDRPGKFCRYTPDSVCNPATLFERNWNRTYVLESAQPIGGVLLVHGLSDSPYSLRVLGEKLHLAGYTVIGLRVPGHGTCPKALAEVSWEDWAAAVRVAMKGLRDRVPADRPLIMVGYSNGGALCVNYASSVIQEGGDATSAATPTPTAIVLISPMIGISPMARFTELFPTVAKLSGEKKLAWSSIEPEIDPFKYSSWPTNASLQARRVTKHVEETLAVLAADGRMERFPPVLTVQSAVDSTVVAHQMIDVLMDRLPKGDSELILFDVRRDELIEGLLDVGFEESIRSRLNRADFRFAVTFITQRADNPEHLVARTRRGSVREETALDLAWPKGVFSLSHVALPISPSDPVYGPGSPDTPAKLPLGHLSMRGENGVLAISPSLLMRMRYNPFYEWTEGRILAWIRARAGK